MKNEQEMAVIKRIVEELTQMSEKRVLDSKKMAQISEMCDKYPHIFEVQFNEYNENLGMVAVELGQKWLVSKALDSPIASVQQDSFGKNIGMHAAARGFEDSDWEDVVLKALDNQDSSIQQDRKGNNIGMQAAQHRLRQATLKALDNFKASIQQNRDGKNIGLIASQWYDWKDVVFKALDNPIASAQQDGDGMNMGMQAASNGHKREASKALLNPVASVQQDKYGWNIGMHAANAGIMTVAEKALKNPIAREERDFKGRTIEDIAKMDKEIDLYKEYDAERD